MAIVSTIVLPLAKRGDIKIDNIKNDDIDINHDRDDVVFGSKRIIPSLVFLALLRKRRTREVAGWLAD